MNSSLYRLALVCAGLVSMASINAQAADGDIVIHGVVSDTTCSINGIASGTPADIGVVLPAVPTDSLANTGDVAGTSNMGDIQMVVSGCSGLGTKAVARFENGPTVDQANGYLKNAFVDNGAKNVEIRLLNNRLQPIDIRNGINNQIAENGIPISGGSAILNYFAQYIAIGQAQAGPVATSVQYTMQYR
ncbi:fimbrial protein [Paraburkholderia humisilvae]